MCVFCLVTREEDTTSTMYPRPESSPKQPQPASGQKKVDVVCDALRSTMESMDPNKQVILQQSLDLVADIGTVVAYKNTMMSSMQVLSVHSDGSCEEDSSWTWDRAAESPRVTRSAHLQPSNDLQQFVIQQNWILFWYTHTQQMLFSVITLWCVILFVRESSWSTQCCECWGGTEVPPLPHQCQRPVWTLSGNVRLWPCAHGGREIPEGMRWQTRIHLHSYTILDMISYNCWTTIQLIHIFLFAYCMWYFGLPYSSSFKKNILPH